MHNARLHACEPRRVRGAAGCALPADVHVPPLPAPPPDGTACNEYLPGDSTLRRFLWVVAFYAANGFYVLLDNHWREDDTVLADPAAWAAKWAQLVRRPTCLSTAESIMLRNPITSGNARLR